MGNYEYATQHMDDQKKFMLGFHTLLNQLMA